MGLVVRTNCAWTTAGAVGCGIVPRLERRRILPCTPPFNARGVESKAVVTANRPGTTIRDVVFGDWHGIICLGIRVYSARIPFAAADRLAVCCCASCARLDRAKARACF